jgi:DNA-binding ferritin-like protein
MRRMLPAVLCLSVVVAGCKAKEAIDQARIASDLNKTGSTYKLMKDVSNDKYAPPADGKLTDSQIQMYLKVREHEKDIAKVAKQQLQQHADAAKNAGDKSIAGMIEGFKGLGSVADLATSDIRAAKDLGYNTQEYLWIKGQVLAVSTTAVMQKVGDAMSAQMDASYQQMKKAYDEAKDDQTKAMYKGMLDAFEKQKQDSAASQPKEDPAMAYNRQLLSKYENVLNAYTSEMGKYEDKDGDAKKSMDQFQKDLDAKAKQ